MRINESVLLFFASLCQWFSIMLLGDPSTAYFGDVFY